MSSNALTVVRDAEVGFTPEQIAIIKSQVAPAGTTNEELQLFMMYCQRTGLDPFARQIYLSERRAQVNGQWTVTRRPETTIDGFRISAERSRQYAGQLGPFWCDAQGKWFDAWLFTDPPIGAKVGVLRHDFKEPLWAVALYDEYCQRTKEGTPNSMWKRMPANQLAKCAESLALRRAFPRELSGLYTREEMPEERSEAKQAQTETAQRRIAELKQRSEPPAEIVQWADIEPDQPKGLEKASDGSDISFKALAAFGIVKKELRALSGTDDVYYAMLQAAGVQHANELAHAAAKPLYKLLAAEQNRLKVRAENMAVLEQSRAVLGDAPFMEILGQDYGCENIGEALSLEGVRWEGLLKTLKAEIDQRRSKSV